LRESTFVLIQYLSGLFVLVFGALHFASLTFLGVKNLNEALEYQNVLTRYKQIFWLSILGILMIAVTSHTFVGFRSILIEIKQGKKWELFVTLFAIIAGGIIILSGFRTILLAFLR